MSRGPSVVLLYHRIAEEAVDPLRMCVSPEHFEEQVEVLQRVARVVPAAEIARASPGSVAITFDDGYRDVFDGALPLLASRGMPSTVFLVAGALVDECPFWWDRLVAAVYARGRSRPVRLTIDGKTRGLGLRNRLSRRIALRKLLPALRAMSPDAREQAIEDLEKDSPAAGGPLPGVATVDDVRRAAGEHLEVGSHTYSHPSLSAIHREVSSAEIFDSKRLLEAQLGVEVRTFAYPFGARGTFGEEAVEDVREAGYACAFTNIPGSFRPGNDVFRIPRRVVGDWPGPVFEKKLRGWLGSR